MITDSVSITASIVDDILSENETQLEKSYCEIMEQFKEKLRKSHERAKEHLTNELQQNLAKKLNDEIWGIQNVTENYGKVGEFDFWTQNNNLFSVPYWNMYKDLKKWISMMTISYSHKYSHKRRNIKQENQPSESTIKDLQNEFREMLKWISDNEYKIPYHSIEGYEYRCGTYHDKKTHSHFITTERYLNCTNKGDYEKVNGSFSDEYEGIIISKTDYTRLNKYYSERNCRSMQTVVIENVKKDITREYVPEYLELKKQEKSLNEERKKLNNDKASLKGWQKRINKLNQDFNKIPNNPIYDWLVIQKKYNRFGLLYALNTICQVHKLDQINVLFDKLAKKNINEYCIYYNENIDDCDVSRTIIVKTYISNYLNVYVEEIINSKGNSDWIQNKMNSTIKFSGWNDKTRILDNDMIDIIKKHGYNKEIFDFVEKLNDKFHEKIMRHSCIQQILSENVKLKSDNEGLLERHKSFDNNVKKLNTDRLKHEEQTQISLKDLEKEKQSAKRIEIRLNNQKEKFEQEKECECEKIAKVKKILENSKKELLIEKQKFQREKELFKKEKELYESTNLGEIDNLLGSQ